MYKTARNLTVLGVGLSISAIVGWLLLRESKRGREVLRLTIKSQGRTSEPKDLPEIVLPLESLESRSEPVAGTSDMPSDDLTQIRDIGPRFAEALKAIGITGFAQLAEQTPEGLAKQLAPHIAVRSQRIRTKDWIGQAARLAKSK